MTLILFYPVTLLSYFFIILLEQNEIVPYSLVEESRIIAGCNKFGRGNYERLCALAMVLLFRHAALSVGDVEVFARDRVVRQNCRVLEMPPTSTEDGSTDLPADPQ